MSSMEVDGHAQPERANSMQEPPSQNHEAALEADTSLPVTLERHLGSTPEVQQQLRRIAQSEDLSGVDWIPLKEAMKARIDEHLCTFQTSDTSLFDKALSEPWLATPEQVASTKARLFAKLDEFTTRPPFTIQRLAELALSPIPHYSNSLPKYVRALHRCLFVASPYGAFEQTAEDTSANGGLVLPGQLIRSRSRSSSVSSTSSRSSHNMAILSPIPWLRRDLTPEPDSLSLDDVHPLGTSDPHHLSGPPSPALAPSELPNGRIDELDAGPESHKGSDPAGMLDRPVELGLSNRFVSAGTDGDQQEQEQALP